MKTAWDNVLKTEKKQAVEGKKMEKHK